MKWHGKFNVWSKGGCELNFRKEVVVFSNKTVNFGKIGAS